MYITKCYACDKPVKIFGAKAAIAAITSNGQFVVVGAECARRIKKSMATGYQPPLGRPKLYKTDKIYIWDQESKNIRLI